MGEYNVVFEGLGVENGGNFQGVRTWSSYKDRESFLEGLKGEKLKDKVLAEGVTQDEAVELAGQQPIHYGIAAAITEACNNEARDFDKEVYRMKIETLFSTLSAFQRRELEEKGWPLCFLSAYSIPEARRALLGTGR